MLDVLCQVKITIVENGIVFRHKDIPRLNIRILITTKTFI